MSVSISVSVYDEATSTSDLAKQALLDGALSGTAFQALIQTKGRGRHGRFWSSPKGNLYLSLVFLPSRPMMEWPGVSLVISIALAKALGQVIAPNRISLKWPNDVLVDGKKIAGILIEAHEKGMIIGIGVNMISAPEVSDGGWPTICLADIIKTNKDENASEAMISLDAFRDILIIEMETALSNWQISGLQACLQEWMALAAFLGQMIYVQDDTNDRIEGVFRGINPDGTMRLELAGGDMLSLAAGDVKRARPVASLGN